MKTIVIILFIAIISLLALYYIFIGNPDKCEPEIVKLNEPIKLIGIEVQTDDKSIYKDAGRITKRFNEIKSRNPVPDLKQPWARLYVSKDYNAEARTFKYIVGDVVTQIDSIPEGLNYYEVPASVYAVFTIKPKSRLVWGITMGRMKRYIFTEWLPVSGYEASGIIDDFELHDERSLGKSPQIDLYVALKETGE